MFVVDRQSNVVERVSEGTGGIQGNGLSLMPDISGDGRYVVFVSASTNWDPRDTHPGRDVYLHDRLTKTTELISVHIQPPTITNSGSGDPRISADGRYVAFQHPEDNILPGDSNSTADVFLHDRVTGLTELVSLDSSGVQSNGTSDKPALSADGRYVAFVSDASNWYPGNTPTPYWKPYVYVRDRSAGTLIPVNLGPTGLLGPGSAGWEIDLSDDGRFLVYLYGWLNVDLTATWDSKLFVRDLLTGETQPIGYSVFGDAGWIPPLGVLPMLNPSISGDGRFVVFDSYYDEHVLHSGNRGGINVFLHDRLTGLTQAASLGPNGQWPDLSPQTAAEAYQGSISPDGTAVAFLCEDPSFGAGNAWFNVYVRSCDWKGPQLYCDPLPSSLGCRPALSFTGTPSASAGVGFTVQAQHLVGQGVGMFFYSTARAILTPFQGGYLCMEGPRRRLPGQATTGSPPPGCTGAMAVDFNAWIAAGADPDLVPGENVCLQAWSRDPGTWHGTSLTDALAFVVGF